MANSRDRRKRYILFAGVNGVGKSTLYYLHPELQNAARINMDEIAKGLGSWKDVSVILEAGKRAIRLREKYLEDGITFNQETTLCGHDAIKTIKRARSAGYYIEMHYVGVESPEICKARIHKRVEEGGHGVPDDLVDKRFKTSLQNLKISIPLCDQVFFYDNTKEFKLFCVYEDGLYKYQNVIVPDWFTYYCC